jgi:hypothetical protein
MAGCVRFQNALDPIIENRLDERTNAVELFG